MSFPPTDLAGRVAVVTGASRGIGREIAVQLAARGVVVAAVARSVDDLQETAGSIRAAGGRAEPFAADLLDTAGLANLVDRISTTLGPVDVLVNNAGTGEPLGYAADLAVDDWAAAVAVNLTAPVALTLAVLPPMVARGWGRIVNVSSLAVGRPGAMIGANAYVTSKTALEAHTINLAAEVDGSGVLVNVFRPGVVDTAMHAAIRESADGTVDPRMKERFRETHARGDLISPQYSAQRLLGFLSRDEHGQVWDAATPL